MRIAIRPSVHHFHDLAAHFLALSAPDRYLRFGWEMNDDDVVAYVETLMLALDTSFVVIEPAPDISGVAHLEMFGNCANLGLSVSTKLRGNGIGTLLLKRVGLLANACGVGTLFVRHLNANGPLRRLASRVGMRVAYAPGAQSLRLELPPWNESVAEHREVGGRITLADHELRHRWRTTRSVFDRRPSPPQNRNPAELRADHVDCS